MPPTRVLFVGRSVAHLAYVESILGALVERGAKLDVAFDPVWSKTDRWAKGSEAMAEFMGRHPGLKIAKVLRRNDRWRAPIFSLRELRSYRSYLVRGDTTPFYVERWRGYLTPTWRRLANHWWFRAMLRSALAGWLLRAAEAATPADGSIVAFLRKRAPDVLVVSPLTMRFSEETDYVKAARKLGIPSVLPVLSWDNLSTKGLIQVMPDRVCVWNEFQKADALEIQHVPEDRIVVSGAPFFDKWFSPPAEAMSRAEFCAQVGLNPQRRILLYLGSSTNIARDETPVVEMLAERLRSHPDPDVAGSQILVRPHPANFKVYRRLADNGFVVWPANGSLPETREGLDAMRNTFAHSDAAAGINTSGMIDSVLADVPTFAVLLPQYAQTQADSRHFRYLEASGALYLPRSVPELVELFASLARPRDRLAVERQAFALSFSRPMGPDRSAGDHIAEVVLAVGSLYGSTASDRRSGIGVHNRQPRAKGTKRGSEPSPLQ